MRGLFSVSDWAMFALVATVLARALTGDPAFNTDFTTGDELAASQTQAE